MRAFIFGAVACGLVAMTASGQSITINKNATTLTAPVYPPYTYTMNGKTYTRSGYVAAPKGTYDVGIGPQAGTNYQVVVQMVIIAPASAGGGYTPTTPPQYPSLNGIDQSAYVVQANPNPGMSDPWNTVLPSATPPGNDTYVMTYNNTVPLPGGQLQRGISAALFKQITGNNWKQLAQNVSPL